MCLLGDGLPLQLGLRNPISESIYRPVIDDAAPLCLAKDDATFSTRDGQDGLQRVPNAIFEMQYWALLSATLTSAKLMLFYSRND